MVVADVDWTLITVAAITAVPAAIAAVLSGLNGRRLKTRNGQTIGSLVEDAHKQSAISNSIVRRTLGQRREDKRVAPKPVKHPAREDDFKEETP